MSVVKSAILTRLQTDSTITALVSTRIYPDVAPEGNTYPFIIVSAQQPPRGARVFQRVGFEESIFLVRGIDKSSSPKNAGAIARAIRTNLEGAALTITGYATRSVEWVSGIEYTSFEDGILYQHEGGFYFVMAEGS